MDDPNFNQQPPDPVQEALDRAATNPPARQVQTDAPREFTGASTQSLAGAIPPAPEHPMAVNQGVASADPPKGGRDENIPVSRGNQHLVLGKRVAAE